MLKPDWLETDRFAAQGRVRNRACAWLGRLAIASVTFGLSATLSHAEDADKIVGPNACAECHKEEAKSWALTHHSKTFRELPRRKKSKEIAKKMGIRRVRSESLCLTCHYTVQKKGAKPRPIAGISCESCHSVAGDWVKIHSGFSGKTKETESEAEKKERWKQAESKGMIRPSALYRLAENCYSCHVVPQEDLVNKGGHSVGSPFELVSWSQGEVRHNTWRNKGKGNLPANDARKRMLYLVGLGMELETSIRSVSKATNRSLYAFAMARRVDRARSKLAVVSKALPAVAEITQMVEQAYSIQLKLNNKAVLVAAADRIAALNKKVASAYDGNALAALDAMIPGPDKFKGKPVGAR